MGVLRVREPFAFDEKNGVQRVMRSGDLLDENDPVVKGKEHLFEAVESTVQRATERATADPGSKRALSRPRMGRKAAEAKSSDDAETSPADAPAPPADDAGK